MLLHNDYIEREPVSTTPMGSPAATCACAGDAFRRRLCRARPVNWRDLSVRA